jgi:hypothetical protein
MTERRSNDRGATAFDSGLDVAEARTHRWCSSASCWRSFWIPRSRSAGRQAVWQRATPSSCSSGRWTSRPRSSGRWRTTMSSCSASDITPRASSRHGSSRPCGCEPTPTARRCLQRSTCCAISTAVVPARCPTTRQSGSCRAAGDRTFIRRRVGSTAITGSCACCRSCAALRAGEIWVQGSRRYTDPQRFLISRTDWPTARAAVLHDLKLPASADGRVGQLLERTARHRERARSRPAGRRG